MSTMNHVFSPITILTLTLITIIFLNIVSVYADEDSSGLVYCAKGEGKGGISVKICSIHKENCDKNVKENEISASCHKIH